MATLRPAPATSVDAPRWGLGDAAGGWFAAQVASVLVGSAVLAAAGYTATESADGEVPLWVMGLQLLPLWLILVGTVWYAGQVKGRGVVADFRARIQAVDVPLGVVVGVLAQLIVVPLVSLPVLWLTNTDADDLSERAVGLGDRADTPGRVALLFLLVAVIAPIVEELFYRGLLLRSLEKTFDTRWAVIGSSLIFGAIHFQALEMVALSAAGLIFAILAVRFDRLGPAVVAHIAFNATTVVHLVWFT